MLITQTRPIGGRRDDRPVACWGPLKVKEVHIALRERDLAYTSILTAMVRLCEKGFLGRTPCKPGVEKGGRGLAYQYTADVSRGQVLAAAMDQLCTRIGADRGDRAVALAVIRGAPQ